MNRKKSVWVEYAAALWALIFAFLHIAWALGWYVGLDAELAREAFARGWFLAYNILAAGLCILAVALALVQFWGRRLPRRLIGVLAYSCAGILILRAGAGVIHFAVRVASAGNQASAALSFWDLWFCLGAILFTATAWRFWRAPVWSEWQSDRPAKVW